MTLSSPDIGSSVTRKTRSAIMPIGDIYRSYEPDVTEWRRQGFLMMLLDEQLIQLSLKCVGTDFELNYAWGKSYTAPMECPVITDRQRAFAKELFQRICMLWTHPPYCNDTLYAIYSAHVRSYHDDAVIIEVQYRLLY